MTSARTTSTILLVLALALGGCATDGTTAGGEASAAQTATPPPSDDPTATAPDPAGSGQPTDEAEATPGAWIDQATYEADPASYHGSGAVVLFFNASWCPTCKETVGNLDTDGVPAGLTVVDVDFDASPELRRQYGVTVQHTFVQVDSSGEALGKFTGSLTGEEIAGRLA